MDIQTGLLLPAIVQALMVLALSYTMGISRFVSARSGKVDMREVVKTGKWPGKLGVLSDSFNNQFQMPQIFYVVCIILTLLGEVAQTNIIIAWLFVALRFVHMIWHNTKNIVIIRFILFVLSGTALTVLVIKALLAML